MGLLNRLPVKNNPSEKRYQISEKGKKVIELLLKINDVLKT